MKSKDIEYIINNLKLENIEYYLDTNRKYFGTDSGTNKIPIKNTFNGTINYYECNDSNFYWDSNAEYIFSIGSKHFYLIKSFQSRYFEDNVIVKDTSNT